MEIIKALVPIDQRRMKIMLFSMGVNYLLFTIGIFKGVDFSDLGAGLALVNTPIVTWIIGESIRPTQAPNTTYSSTSTQTSIKTDEVKPNE
jgi:hypothetical protein